MAHDDAAGPVLTLRETTERLAPHGEATHTEHGLSYLTRGRIDMEHGGAIRRGPVVRELLRDTAAET